MSSILSPINLQIGKALSALSSYPKQIRNLRRFSQNERGILITGAPRSGTTWAGRMISSSGLWHIHEPFNPNQKRWKESFSYAPRGKENPTLDRFVMSLLKGGFRKAVLQAGNYPIGSITRYAPFPASRVLIKDPHASLLSDYIAVNFPIDVIVLFRHPAAFVASFKKLGWGSCDSIKQLMQSPGLMEKLDAYGNEIKAASMKEGIESLAVLHSVLSRMLWEFCGANHSMTPVLFEDLCAEPILKFEAIFEELELPYNQRIREKHIGMCSGNEKFKSNSPHNVVRDSALMASKWKAELVNDEIEIVRQVWEKFQVPIYQADHEWI